MNLKTVARCAPILALVLGGAMPARAQSGATEYTGAEALGLALRRLGPTERVLMIGAHPDDEDTQLLAELALGRGADVAYLSLTRGDGGQNAIGGEFQEALGLLRTEELLAARRLDGAAQFFTRAYDYGFSKSADEAFRHWPRDSVLGDVVRVIREFRPDVVVSVFTGTPRDGHGQHQAAGILARAAFDAAGDPTRFPEQIAAGLAPFTPSKLYQGSWFRLEEATLRIPTGELDLLLGRSYYQVAMASRSRHRSQDMGRPELPGPRYAGVTLVRERGRGAVDGSTTEDASLLAGVDSTLALRAATLVPGGSAAQVARLLAAYDSLARATRAGLNALDPETLVPGLTRARSLLVRADSLLQAGSPLRYYVEREAADAARAASLAAGLMLDAVSSVEQVVPGDTFMLELTLWNGGDAGVGIRRLAPMLPSGWTATPLDSAATSAAPQSLVTRRFRVRVPADARVTEPYFLRRPRNGDLYAWPAGDPSDGLPFEPGVVQAWAVVAVDGVPLPLTREATYRLVDPQQGESRRPVRVVPAASVSLDPGVAVLPIGGTAAPLRVTARVTAEARSGVDGTLSLAVPEGWRAEPATAPVRLSAGESRSVEFTVTPAPGTRAGSHQIAATLAAGGTRYARGFHLVDYPHIRPRPLYHDATTLVQALDVKLPRRLTVGYVMGAGDAVPQALEQLGVDVEPLDAAALASADLSRYDDIVVGVRAYEVRPDVAAQNQRLLDYVRNGGTLIVQYQMYGYPEGNFAPYPISVARPHERVTDEDAPVTFLAPSHPALTTPNRLTASDFEGWVQERGLYFLHSWDPKYVPLLQMNDPGEDPLKGALVVAPYGKGTYVYTGLALFRQLPAGVPGAYRLFANLLSLGVR